MILYIIIQYFNLFVSSFTNVVKSSNTARFFYHRI